jgi:hypothetical protein
MYVSVRYEHNLHKIKIIPVTGRGVVQGSETSSISHCEDNRLTVDSEVSALRAVPATPHGWFSPVCGIEASTRSTSWVPLGSYSQVPSRLFFLWPTAAMPCAASAKRKELPPPPTSNHVKRTSHPPWHRECCLEPACDSVGSRTLSPRSSSPWPVAIQTEMPRLL